MSDPVIETCGLTKKYGNQNSVSNLSIHVKKGRIYGLLGRNGAGKTTTMRMLLGLTAPSSGDVKIFGKPLRGNEKTILSRIGSLIESPGFYPNLTGTENLQIFAGLRGLKDPKYIRNALEVVSLPYRDKKLFSQYSLGMKQRLSLAMALVGEPDILILDEPVNGLDPTGILHVREQVRYLNEQKGVTIIISSHFLGELGKVATVYGVMKEGRLVGELRGDDLRSLARPKIKIVTPDLVRALPVLQSNFAPADYAIGQNGAVEIYRDASALGTVTLMFAEAGVPLLQISAEEGDSEAALVALM